MKQVTIISSKKNQEMQSLLAGEIVEKDADIKVVSMDEKEYGDTKSKMTTLNKIILLGNSKELKSYENIVHYKVNDEFGFRYGWLANVAVVDVDERKVNLKKSDAIVAEIHRFSGVDQDSQSKQNSDEDEKNKAENVSLSGKIKRGLGAGIVGGAGEAASFGTSRIVGLAGSTITLASPLGAMIAGFGAVSMAEYLAVIGTKKYKVKKDLIRDMKISLIERFVSDEDTGLNAFMNN